MIHLQSASAIAVEFLRRSSAAGVSNCAVAKKLPETRVIYRGSGKTRLSRHQLKVKRNSSTATQAVYQGRNASMASSDARSRERRCVEHEHAGCIGSRCDSPHAQYEKTTPRSTSRRENTTVLEYFLLASLSHRIDLGLSGYNSSRRRSMSVIVVVVQIR
jgi:hypothetical protein